MRRPILLIAFFTLSISPAFAWHDATHMAVAKAAGLDNYSYLAVGADMAKEKAGDREQHNHWCNIPRGTVVTAKMVLDQVSAHGTPDKDGHLYGAIIASLNRYRAARGSGKYANYPLGYAIHYLGDLSMPFHNTVHVGHEMHVANDGIVEGDEAEGTDRRIARISSEIRKRVQNVSLPKVKEVGEEEFNEALAAEIARLANESMALGYGMLDQGRGRMTEEQAYSQLAKSASLLKAVYHAHQ
jgi:hypothetical protein